MAKKKTVPLTAVNKRDEKLVKIPPQTPHSTPSWKFSTVDRGGPFQWPEDDSELIKDIVKKLSNFDSMKWDDIKGIDHHSIPKHKLSKVAQERLEEINLDDIDTVFSLHFNGKKRIIGIKDLNVMKLLWWDQEHEVCPSPKKHT